MKTIKVKIKKEHEIELQLPAYFSQPTMEWYIKIISETEWYRISLGLLSGISYNKNHTDIPHIIKNYDILDPKEGEKVWQTALTELKKRINSL